jgi:hypothetical protein
MTTIRDLEEEMSWIEWTSVLKLSLMWQMKWVHDLALREVPTRICDSDGWCAALETSTLMGIRGLRELAIRQLDSGTLSPMKKVNLGIQNNIESWLMGGYKEFVTREEVISVEDEDQLGWSRTSALFRIRHRVLDRQQIDISSSIRNAFKNEFADIAASLNYSLMSYLRPELCTATNHDVIRRDEVYYTVDIVFSVMSFKSIIAPF